jgi:TonB family protein
MPSQCKYASIPDMPKLWYLAPIMLLGIAVSLIKPSYSQAESPQDSFRGTFYLDPSAKLDTDKDSPISPSLVFQESNSENKYAIFAQSLFKLSLRQEYIIEGIFVQKHLPEKPKSADYGRIVQMALPDTASYDLKSVSKIIEGWIKDNPNKPLLIISSLRKAESSQMRHRQLIRVGGNVQESNLIKRIDPVYPVAAKQRGISGKVVLQVTVDENGSVEQVKPISGPPLLSPAAMAAVLQWKYKPSSINGEAVAVVATVTVIFQLR